MSLASSYISSYHIKVLILFQSWYIAKKKIHIQHVCVKYFYALLSYLKNTFFLWINFTFNNFLITYFTTLQKIKIPLPISYSFLHP